MPPVQTRRQFGHQAMLACLATLVADALPARARAKPAPATAGRREVIRQALPGKPDRDMTLVEVTYAPGQGSPAHLHAKGVMAFVVSGAVASKVDDGPEQVFRAGQAWWEPPGAVHRQSRNASATEPATLLAIYVAPRNATAAELVRPL